MTAIDTYRGQTLLITGGRGYMGSALAQALAGIDCRLVLLDQSPQVAWRPEAPVAEVSVRVGDVSCRETWERVLPDVDVVFHLAAKEYIYRSDYDPEQDYRMNALPVLHLLEVCRESGHRPRIVFASSANVYGCADRQPVNECTPDNPLTMWAVHKLTAERYLRLYADRYGLSALSLRLANVYGPTARWSTMDRMVLNRVLRMALDGNPLVTYTNRDCLRDYVYVDDAVRAFLAAGSLRDVTGSPVFVIGSGDARSIADTWQVIAERVEAVTGQPVSPGRDDAVEVEPVERRHFVADTRRFEAATGWTPTIGFEQGIDITTRTIVGKAENML